MPFDGCELPFCDQWLNTLGSFPLRSVFALTSTTLAWSNVAAGAQPLLQGKPKISLHASYI